MSSEWQSTTLGAICNAQGGAIQTGPFGSQLHTSDYKEHGVPVVMPTNIGDGGISEIGIARIDDSDVERLSQHKLRLGDIVFSRRGDVTKNALIQPHEVGWLCGTGCLKVRVGERRIADERFISYHLRSPGTKEWLVRHAVGATMPNLNTGILASVPIMLPPLNVQLRIGEILGSLDDCIAILRETNATLEVMAQAIFKSWFVDFDPVRAKAEGRQPERMDAATAALFPDSFEDSELGEVPAGWSVFPIGELVKCVGGATPSTKNSEFWEPAEFSWTTPKDLSGLQSPILHKTEKMVSSKGVLKISSGLLPAGTLLMSSRAPIGYLAISSIDVAVNQGYIAIPPGGKLSPLYLLHWCRQNMELIKSHANGSTFMEISKKAFRPLPALLPSVEVLAEFTKRVSPIFESIAANDRQINLLAEIRDTLLPKLISGEIRLPEAESIVRSAVNA